MKLSELLAKVKDLPPDTLVCVAEVDEAFAIHIDSVEVIDSARAQSQKADGTEAVELANGKERAVVIRW